jgi:hypothetical protein
MDEALVLCFQTPGREVHRFIITNEGIVKQDCDRTGANLYDPNR